MRKNICFFALTAVLAALLILSCPNDDENNKPAPTPSNLPDVAIPADIMGMVHAGYHFGDDQEYAQLDEMGVVWMLRDFSWGSIQPSADTWRVEYFDQYVEAAARNNKKIVAILDYDVRWIHDETCGHSGRVVAGENEVEAFCEYVRKTVEYYKGKVGAWSIWNEPNLNPRFWTGTPEEFFILTKAAAAAAREVDPDAILLGGGFNTEAVNDIWTKGIFEFGAMEQIDFLSYHPYMPDAGTSGEIYKRFRDYVDQYGFANKIWITEVGYPLDMEPWPGGGGYGTKVKEADFPDETAKTIAILAAEGARVILWYEMFDHGVNGDKSDSEDWFGLVDRTSRAKKGGGEAYQICAHNIPGKTLRHSLLDRSGIPDYIATYYFEGAGGDHTLIVWNDRQLTRPQRVRVTLPGTDHKVWNVATGTSATVNETSTWTLKTRDDAGNGALQFFTWKNSDVTKPPRVTLE